jgi:plasmid maintenance system antidote protein VapI
MVHGRDLLIQLDKHHIPIYVAAARVGRHPVTLGRMLRERIDLPPEVARRLQAVIDEAPR